MYTKNKVFLETYCVHIEIYKKTYHLETNNFPTLFRNENFFSQFNA